MAMSRDQFIQFTQPEQLKYILDAFDAGLADYDNPDCYGPGAKIAHTKSLRAQNRNGQILYHAKMMAWERPELGVRYELYRGRPLFWLNERGRISFKLVDRNLRHRNYPTQQALDFDAQRVPALADVAQPLSMPLWPPDAAPPVTNLVAGYRMDKTETTHEAFVICPDGEGYAWYWPLTRADILELMATKDRASTAAAEKIQKRPLPLRAKKKDAKKENL